MPRKKVKRNLLTNKARGHIMRKRFGKNFTEKQMRDFVKRHPGFNQTFKD